MTFLEHQHRLRIIRALRFTVLCALIVSTNAIAGMSIGIATLVPAMMLSLFLKDESIASSLSLLMGVIVGVQFVFLNTYFWAQLPLFYLLSSLSVLVVLGYWIGQATRGRWRFLPFPLGACLSISSATFSAIGGAQNGIEAASIWLEEVPIGMLLFWVVLIGVWPSPTARDLTKIVSAIESDCALMLRGMAQLVLEAESVSKFPSPLVLKDFRDTARLLKVNKTKFDGGEQGYKDLLNTLDRLFSYFADIQYIQRSLEDLPNPGLPSKVRKAVSVVISALSDQMEKGTRQDLSTAFEVLENEENKLMSAANSDIGSRRIASRLSSFNVAAKSLQKRISTTDRSEIFSQSLDSTANTENKVLIEADSLKASLKLVIGVLLGLLLIEVTNLPASAYLVVAILVVLSQPNAGRAHLRVRLWFPGVVLGSLWAIIGLSVLSLLPHFGVYLVWYLPGLFVAGYLGSGPDRYAFMGMQTVAGMATIMGMAAFPSQTFLFAEERVLGACIGFMVSLCVYHLLWPIHPAVELRKSIAVNLKKMAELVSLLSQISLAPEKANLVAEIHGRTASLKAQIEDDFGLLSDFSFMITRKVHPNYNYRRLTQELGFMFSQLWNLSHSISLMQNEKGRASACTAVEAVKEELTEVLEDIAARIEMSKYARTDEFEPTIRDIKEQLISLQDRTFLDASQNSKEELAYGTNVIRLFSLHILRFVDAMYNHQASGKVGSAQLGQAYEAVGK
ncbi:MAG: FUSC family protein [Pseudomonadota bacterium]